MGQLNLLAVIVVAIINILIGSMWYSPTMFGRQWMKLVGITKRDLKKRAKHLPRAYFWNVVSALVMSYVLAQFILYTSASTVAQGAFVGFVCWLGFIATLTLGQMLWEGRPQRLWILNNAYWLLSLVVMGAILAVW